MMAFPVIPLAPVTKATLFGAAAMAENNKGYGYTTIVNSLVMIAVVTKAPLRKQNKPVRSFL